MFFDHPNGGWEWDVEKPSTVRHLPSLKQRKYVDIDGWKLIVSFWDGFLLASWHLRFVGIPNRYQTHHYRSIEASRNRRESGGPVFLLSVNFLPKDWKVDTWTLVAGVSWFRSTCFRCNWATKTSAEAAISAATIVKARFVVLSPSAKNVGEYWDDTVDGSEILFPIT